MVDISVNFPMLCVMKQNSDASVFSAIYFILFYYDAVFTLYLLETVNEITFLMRTLDS